MSGVVIAAERLAPERGGLARATARIAEMAAARGEEVHVVRQVGDHVPGARRQIARQGYLEHALGRRDGDEANARSFVDHIVDVVESCGADLVHGIYGTTAGYAATVAGAFANVASVVSLRGNDVDRGLFRAEMSRLMLAVERASVVTAVTREMARRVGRLARREVQFVPNAVDTQAFVRRTPDNTLRVSLGLGDGPVIGFSGELREKKGLRFLLPAFAALRRDMPLSLCLIGGVRPDAEEAFDAFTRAEPDAAAAIRTLRYASEPDVLGQRLALCDVMVFPSLYEGMPNAVLEAMAAECAILATDVGGHGELIEHGVSGALLSLRDLDRLPEAIREALDLPVATRRAWGRAARARVQEGHRPEDETRAWAQVYAQARSLVA
ncbi:MAG: glycosyltransferase family 4 protein [Myxococcota bacterium]